MALVHEDGTAKANAESYVSVADADAYHLARGNSTWTLLTTAQKEEALRRATDYILQTYRSRWKGYRKTATQALDWPRTFVYLEPFVHGIVGTYPYLVEDTVVPTEIKNATAEMALKAAAGELSADLGRSKSSVRVGEISVTYDQHSPEYTRYRAVDAILSPYLNGSSLNLSVMRT